MSSGGWGWSPTTPAVPVPPSAIFVREGTGLQAVVDALPNGGLIQLGEGTYYAVIATPNTVLVVPLGVIILGVGQGVTFIGSPINFTGSNCMAQDLTINPVASVANVQSAGSIGLTLNRCTFDRSAGSVANMVALTTCFQAAVTGCLFSMSGASATAAMAFDSNIGIVEGNLFTGWGAVTVATIDGTDVRVGPNSILSGGGIIVDTSE